MKCGFSGFPNNELATGSWEDAVNATGWAFLNVNTNPKFNDEITSEAAGYLEGYITAERIYQNVANSGFLNPISPVRAAFLNNNSVWMNAQLVAAHSLPVGNPTRVYWRHVKLALNQLDGLCRGYAESSFGKSHPLTPMQIKCVTYSGDFDDLPDSNGFTVRSAADENGHCSALIRLTSNNDDLYISQVTWSSVNSMLRVYKMYDFPFLLDDGLSTVPAKRMAFSSYPGCLFSGDDFYQMSSGLVVQETTIGFDNESLTQFIVPTTVLEWLRNMIANRLATDGPSWVSTYSLHNSGTYNNQNMILNYNKFVPGRPVQAGLLYICEQIPGYIRSHDVSMMLETQRYFGSYNTAFDPEIREIGGANANVAHYGPWFEYESTPRALIFRRGAPNVHNIDDMKRIMRYNNFRNDTLSLQLPSCQFLRMTNCTPPYSGENAISCRCDLNPLDGVYAFPALGFRNHVGTDAKISSFRTFNPKSLHCWAISGPTYDDLPPFQFSTSPFNNTTRLGLPDLWQFPWVEINWTTNSRSHVYRV